MNKCLYPRKHEPHKVFFTWQITYKCNYRCTYCNAPKHGQPNVVDTIILSKDKWIKFWDEIYDMYGECEITISGGEPSIYPKFFEIIQEVSKFHKITIITNLSFDIKSIYYLDNRRVRFNASYHPESTDINSFIKKIVSIQENGFDIQADFVTWPPFIKNLGKIKKEFHRNVIDLVIHPFVGVYDGIKYPNDYSTAQKKRLLNVFTEDYNKQNVQFNTEKGANNNVNKFCRMGENYAFIKPNGDVERCCKNHSMSLGNIVRGTFKLLNEARKCNVNECNCWRCMIVNKENDWKDHWGTKEHFDIDLYLKKISNYKNMFVKKEISKKQYLCEKTKWFERIKNSYKSDRETRPFPQFSTDCLTEILKYGKEIVSEKKDSYNGNMLICIAKKEEGDNEGALEYANKLIEINKNRPEGYELKGELEILMGNDEGYKILDRIFNLYIKNENRTYDIACKTIYLIPKVNNTLKLIRHINFCMSKLKNIKNKIKLVDLYMKVVDVCMSKRMFKKAIKIAEKAIKLDGDNFNILSMLGLLNILTRNYNKAEEYLMKAININDKEKHIYILLGRLNLEQGDIKKAKKLFQKVLEFSKCKKEKRNALNMLFLELQRIEDSQTVDTETILSIRKWLKRC